jgi:hypothetical protein
MKKYLIICVALLLVACDTKTTLFNMTYGGSFMGEKTVSTITGKSVANTQKLSIGDTRWVFITGKDSTAITNLRTTYQNAKQGKKIIEGYDEIMKVNRSIRIIYVGYWNNRSTGVIITGPLMIGEYQAKNDTLDIYYKRISTSW